MPCQHREISQQSTRSSAAADAKTHAAVRREFKDGREGEVNFSQNGKTPARVSHISSTMMIFE